MGTIWGPHVLRGGEQPARRPRARTASAPSLTSIDAYSYVLGVKCVWLIDRSRGDDLVYRSVPRLQLAWYCNGSWVLGGLVHREALGNPCPETSDYVGGTVQPQAAQRVRGEARGITLHAQYDHLQVVAGCLG